MPKYNLQILSNAYSSKISHKQYQCLHNIMSDWQKTKPFKGRKILVNQHITLFTLTFVHTLIIAGAEVEVVATKDLNVHGKSKKEFDALTPLKNSNILFHPDGNIPTSKKTKYYDIVFDCGAGLLNDVVPKFGSLELTKTPRNIYQNMNYPVVDVDDSKTKEIETHYGTGDGFIRFTLEVFKAQLSDFSNSHMLYAISPQALFYENRYVIFGYGKVGTGIADGLKVAGVPSENIFILDIDQLACNKAKNDGFDNAFLLNGDTSKIKSILSNAFCVVTATGGEDVISQAKWFDKAIFDQIPFKINMGTYDEFGKKFKETEIMADKHPANFSLNFPTSVIYLDAVFSAFIKAGEALLHKENNFHNGLNKLPNKIDEEVQTQWIKKYSNNKWEHLNAGKGLSSDIHKLRHNFAKNQSNYNTFPILFNQRYNKNSSTNAMRFFHKNKKALACLTIGAGIGVAASTYYHKIYAHK